jgi:biopolymer transport protein ExbD
MLLALKGFTQPKNEINLPNGGKDIEINNLTSLYSLYITKNQEVFNDDKKLEYFQDVNYTFLNQLNKNISMGIPLVLVYADVKTPFKFVSKIKQYIPNHRWVFYMTENIEGLKATAFRNYGSAKNFELEEILTMEEENDLLDEEFLFETLPINSWHFDFEKTMHSGNKEAIIEALNSYSHSVLTISQHKTVMHNELFLNDESLKKLIKANQVLFLDCDDDIFYEDYIDAIQKIKKHQITLEKNEEDKAYIIEVSLSLKKHFKEMDIELN